MVREGEVHVCSVSGDPPPAPRLHRYSSRLAYSRTAAVMSIVGYVLGLGDRHGENVLFDSTNGDCIHVDFNCLFNRVGSHCVSVEGSSLSHPTPLG